MATLYRPSDAVASAASPAHWPGGVYVLELAPTPDVDLAAGRMGPAARIDPEEGSQEGWFVSLIVHSPD